MQDFAGDFLVQNDLSSIDSTLEKLTNEKEKDVKRAIMLFVIVVAVASAAAYSITQTGKAVRYE